MAPTYLRYYQYSSLMSTFLISLLIFYKVGQLGWDETWSYMGNVERKAVISRIDEVGAGEE